MVSVSALKFSCFKKTYDEWKSVLKVFEEPVPAFSEYCYHVELKVFCESFGHFSKFSRKSTRWAPIMNLSEKWFCKCVFWRDLMKMVENSENVEVWWGGELILIVRLRKSACSGSVQWMRRILIVFLSRQQHLHRVIDETPTYHQYPKKMLRNIPFSSNTTYYRIPSLSKQSDCFQSQYFPKILEGAQRVDFRRFCEKWPLVKAFEFVSSREPDELYQSGALRAVLKLIKNGRGEGANNRQLRKICSKWTFAFLL